MYFIHTVHIVYLTVHSREIMFDSDSLIMAKYCRCILIQKYVSMFVCVVFG